MCPSCYRWNGAWSLYARCPFCGVRGRPIPEVVGPGWEAKFAAMLAVTGGGSHAARCESPLCWGDPHPVRAGDSFPDVSGVLWYPDEEICSAARVNEPGLARVMRRIARLAKAARRPESEERDYPSLVDTYFTLADLRSFKRVDRRVRGRNPDVPFAASGAEPTPGRRGVKPADAILEAML